MPDTDERPLIRWPNVGMALMLACLVAAAANALQGSRSKVDRKRISDEVSALTARLDTADAERRRLKGEVDVLKGMVSGLADPGVERD